LEAHKKMIKFCKIV